MRFCLALLLFLFPMSLLAQTGPVTGQVARADTHTALAKASVFLSNSSYGTITNDDGTFTLSGIKPGQYELVITSIGFEDYNQTIMVGKDPIKINAVMLPKVTELHEVVITTPANWKKNYALFLKEFLGESANAKKCRILNPSVLSFNYHKSKETLEAWSNEFIEIENKALGYKVKFLLKSFTCDYLNNIITWQGKTLFTDLPAKVEQKKLWETKRNEIYYGSSQHFFRSLQNAKLSEDGFAVMILSRKPNPARPQQELIAKKIRQYEGLNMIDSANRWKRLYNLPRYEESLARQPLKETDFARATDQPGVFMIMFPQYLYVIYRKKMETMDLKDIYRPLDMPNYETSIITLYKPYALFDGNGSIISAQSTLIEGTWSKNKVAELLPMDYVPGDMVFKEQ